MDEAQFAWTLVGLFGGGLLTVGGYAIKLIRDQTPTRESEAAVVTRLNSLETEVGHLRARGHEMNNTLHSLLGKLNMLEVLIAERHETLLAVLDDLRAQIKDIRT